MPTSPEPLPAPDAGSNNNSNPKLGVVPPKAEPGPSPFPLNQEVESECTRAEDLADMARKDVYKVKMEKLTINEPFCTALKLDAALARRHNRKGVDADAAGKDATRTEDTAESTLLASLHAVQSAARILHLPDHPDLLDAYLVGQRLDENQETLTSSALSIMEKASEERPPGVDTDFISRVAFERNAVVAADRSQGDESSKGSQERVLRDKMVRSIVTRRKKIQYAADVAFPYNDPANARARTDFSLPANRPYSY